MNVCCSCRMWTQGEHSSGPDSWQWPVPSGYCLPGMLCATHSWGLPLQYDPAHNKTNLREPDIQTMISIPRSATFEIGLSSRTFQFWPRRFRDGSIQSAGRRQGSSALHVRGRQKGSSLTLLSTTGSLCRIGPCKVPSPPNPAAGMCATACRTPEMRPRQQACSSRRRLPSR